MKASILVLIIFVACAILVTLTLFIPYRRLYECQIPEGRGYWLDVYVVTYVPINYTEYRRQQSQVKVKMQPTYGLRWGDQMTEEDYQEKCNP